jgi:DNA-directed RNA polymerase subunit H
VESRSRPGDRLTEEWRFNVLNHVLVPLHEVVPDDQVTPLLKQYGITKEQLPKIRHSDPAVKVIGAKPGQVVRIIRKSPTAGHAVAYRLVVEAI